MGLISKKKCSICGSQDQVFLALSSLIAGMKYFSCWDCSVRGLEPFEIVKKARYRRLSKVQEEIMSINEEFYAN